MFRFCQGRRAKNKLKERQAQLYAIIRKEGISERSSEESKKAIAYCEACIEEYDYWWELNESKWYCWQRVAIIAGVLATIAGAISIPDSWMTTTPWLPFVISIMRSLPAAVATVAAGFLGSFTYREDAVRHKLTKEALWNEMAKYQARADPYDKAEASDTCLFLNKVCRLVTVELYSWSALVRGDRADAITLDQKPPEG